MPKLSIIIPVYNTEQHLKKCIDSILGQTFTDYEIIVVNDCSPGDTESVINKYTNIKYIKLPQNKGTHIAREKGVEQAKGEYLCFIDADDFFLHKDVLTDLVPKFQDADMITYNLNLVYPDGREEACPTIENRTYDKILDTKEDIFFELFNGGMSDGQPVKITKKTVWEQATPYFPKEHIVFYEDYLISIILLYFSRKVITTSYFGYGYYQPYQSATKFDNMPKSRVIKTLTDYTLVNEKADSFMKEKGIYAQYEKDILNKKRVMANILLNQFRSFINTELDLKDFVRKAFDPWFVYTDIKEDITKKRTQKNTCFLSIIMPVFNTEPFLKRCLDSILNQGFTDYEIIVVDDCSPKNCQEIVEGYKNPKISYYKNPVNMGSAWSRLHGLSRATGEYIYFVDSDDWLVEESLEKMYNHLKQTKTEVLQFNGYWATDEKHWEVDQGQNFTLTGQPAIFDYFFDQNQGRKTLWCRVFARDIVLQGAIHMPSEWVSIADDWLLNIYALWYANSMKSVDEYYYYYYQENPNAISNHVENRSKQRAISPEKANHYLKQIDAIYWSLEQFLLNQGIMNTYNRAWRFYKNIDRVNYHIRQMIEGVQQYFLEEIINNPENVIKQIRNMTHNRASTLNIINSITTPSDNNAKELVKKLINKIKGRHKFIGYTIEKTILIMWQIYKKIRY